jgi:hypothetical protein
MHAYLMMMMQTGTEREHWLKIDNKSNNNFLIDKF